MSKFENDLDIFDLDPVDDSDFELDEFDEESMEIDYDYEDSQFIGDIDLLNDVFESDIDLYQNYLD